MPRILGAEKHVLNIHDNLSGTDIQFEYRMPTTEERTNYGNAAVQRRRNKVTQRMTQTRQKYGAAILTGIRDGDFTIMEGGKEVPLSSTSGSDGFREDWKAKLLEHAADLVELLGAQVFEASAMVDEADEGPDLEQD